MPIGSHGKVILFGEHAAVYGHPALAAGLPDALTVVGLEPTSEHVRVRVLDWGVDAGSRDSGPIGRALSRLSRLLPGSGGCDATVRARIPMGAGLGSSAALAVVMVRSLAAARGLTVGPDDTRALAHEMEKVFHGTPSGMDDAVATFGGLCLFRRGGWNGEPIPEGPLVRRAPDVFGLSCPAPRLVIGNSGVPRATSAVVASVRDRHRSDARGVDDLFRAITGCLSAGLKALRSADLKALGDAMNQNHLLLQRLGVSCAELDEMARIAIAAGALGAKLTGAGGGGCVIALAPGREDEVIEAWAAGGFEGWVADPER